MRRDTIRVRSLASRAQGEQLVLPPTAPRAQAGQRAGGRDRTRECMPAWRVACRFFYRPPYHYSTRNPASARSVSQKARCATFHRCLTAASPRDAARLRAVLRVLHAWGLARSTPASPRVRACALHLLCRDAGVLQLPG